MGSPRTGNRSSTQPRACGAEADVLLVTPPLVQPNTPYAATPMLTGFLRSRGIAAVQADASLELLLRLFSPAGVARMAQAAERACPRDSRASRSVSSFRRQSDRYRAAVGPAIRFLQGRDPALANRIVRRGFLPEGPRFDSLGGKPGQAIEASFGVLGTQDRARYYATLFVDDLVDVLREAIDPAFDLARYGEKLAVSLPSFAPLQAALDAPATLVSETIEGIASDLLSAHRPRLVAFTVPFPGCLPGALRMGRWIKRNVPGVAVAIGGGYVSTELRALSEPALFDCVDFVVLDEGPAPLLRLVSHVRRGGARGRLMRTFSREGGRVAFHDARGGEVPHGRTGTPTWDGLPLDRYLSLMEIPNRLHRLWSDGRWNRIALAHGCYWRRCRFCDTNLPYICRYDPAPLSILVRRMEAAINETGQTGFHFVDEAMPPALVGRLSESLLERGVVTSWWGNIRLEASFSRSRVERMRSAGCVAVTGGLETVCDRTLGTMEKGIRVEDAVRTIARFGRAGILVHLYLIYGFPGQTVRETVDALEIVRQLFAAGWVQSAYWHRFALTVHSAMGRDPHAYGMRAISGPEVAFARNEVRAIGGIEPDVLNMGAGLHRAVYNFMHGMGVDEDVRVWFTARVPRPSVGREWVRRVAKGEWRK
jgi:radical SAM superfamily enzyme YgiQ (UPF0313 family)